MRFLSGMQMIIPSADMVLNGFHRRVAEIGNQLDRLLECWLTDPDEMRLQNPFQTLRHFNFKDQGWWSHQDSGKRDVARGSSLAKHINPLRNYRE